MKMRGAFLIPIALFVLLTCVLVYALTGAADGVCNYVDVEKKGMGQYIGREIIVGRDTQVLTNFSLIQGEFTTNTGTTLDKSFVKNQFENE